MNKKHHKIVVWILIVLALAACRDRISSADSILCTPETLEVTRIAPQMVEVTRLVPQLTTTQPQEPPTSTPKPSVPSVSTIIQINSTSIELDPAYFDGFVVLAQYYMLLDHGLYEESYQLLSSAQQIMYSLEDHRDFYSHDLYGIKIIGVQPYDYWRALDKMAPLPAPADELRFVVFLRAFHRGAAWNVGGTPTPDNITGFESLVLENDEWKIDEFNTSPWMTFP